MWIIYIQKHLIEYSHRQLPRWICITVFSQSDEVRENRKGKNKKESITIQ